jgi:hypothetical protein
MIAWGRFLPTTALALLAMLAVATQVVAWAFDQHDALGEAVAVVGGVKLYAPWQVLVWTLQWFAHDVWKALLHLGLTAMALLAAFGWAALAQAIQPPTFRPRLWRPGFERWARLSQSGLLRGDGLALLGVRRHVFARPEILRVDAGHVLLLGASVHTDDALLAAAANRHGALVFIEARDLASRLPRQDVLRFAPGRADAIAINPLLGVRGGAHAWSDAVNLARGFLRSEDDVLVASLAGLVLDTLTHAKPEARSLSGMRQALADPQRRLAEFCARWAERAESDLGPATGELTRIARYWRRDGEAALKTMRDVDRRLGLFSDGDHALATEGHQLRFADLVAGDVSSLVIQLPPGRERLTAPLVSALLAQLVTACASVSDRDHLGRDKRRDLLIVIEANALTALAADPEPAEPVNAAWKKKPLPLFDGSTCGACERRVRFLVQADSVEDASALIGAKAGDFAEEAQDVFAAIAAIGPQTETSAAFAAALAGQVWVWERPKHQSGRLSRWLLPRWERAVSWAIPAEDLQRAEAGEALLLLAGMKPMRGRSLITGRASAQFLTAASVASAPHAWDAPALPSAAVSASVALSASPTEKRENAEIPLPLPIGGLKLRRALSRRAAPELKPDRGERLI